MPNATALITCVTPDVSPSERRSAELELAARVGAVEDGSPWPRQYEHGLLVRADEAVLQDLADEYAAGDLFLVRVYPDADGEAVVVGTWTVTPYAGTSDEAGSDPEQITPGEEPPPSKAGDNPAARAPWTPAPIAIDGPPPDLGPLTIRPGEPWRDWIVQLWAPPNPAVVAMVGEMGWRIVGTVGAFGLHVRTRTAVKELPVPFPEVRWVGPYHPYLRVQPALLSPGIAGMIIDAVAIRVDDAEARAEVQALLAKNGAELLADPRSPALLDLVRRPILARLPADAVGRVARHPGVVSIHYASRTPTPESEREAQVVAGNIERVAPGVAGVDPGYRAWLYRMGLTGAGATIAICDTGVASNAGNARVSLPDLDRRQVASFDYTEGAVVSDTSGHGTHVAGLAVGSGILGGTSAGELSLGLGVAPGASYVTQNATATPESWSACDWWPPTTLLPYTRDASRAGATIFTMAWTTDPAFVAQGYVPFAAELDGLVRDPADTGAPGGELVVVASAGNAGPRDGGSISQPKEAKNIIVVGASTNAPRLSDGTPESPDGIATFSSRGPAIDGRNLPTVVAPGVNVASTVSTTADDPNLRLINSASVVEEEPATVADYAFLDGTSMGVGLVAGACALLDEWWRAWGDTAPPGAALTRALLVIGADDLWHLQAPKARASGLGPIPDAAQGWGRVNLGNILCQTPPEVSGPFTARGPKRVERGAFHFGDTPHRRRYARARDGLPVRVALAWTDPPGSPGKSPALCNDLDLVVVETPGKRVWSGNRFEGGWSAPGRKPDTRNNLECVYLREPPEVVSVVVEPSALTADARPPYSLHTPWQDYALVLENLVPVRGEMRAIALLDRSHGMGALGTLTAMGQAWQGFTNSLRRGDALGLVRFADTGTRVLPPTRDDLPELLGEDDFQRYATAVASTPSGPEGSLLAGLVTVQTLAPAPVVLLSDGTFGDALLALAKWRARAPIHPVGLWPTASEGALNFVARRTGGVYSYGPTESLLGAALAELRAELTGDPVIRSEVLSVGGGSRQATVAIPVEDGATELTFALTWDDKGLRAVRGRTNDPQGLGISLRTPDGHLLPGRTSVALVTTGPGSATLTVGNPRPGRWVVELHTRAAAPVAVHVAASVPAHPGGGPRLRARFWPPEVKTGERLFVIARWDDVPGLDPQDANVSGEVERPFATTALNAAHRRRVTAAQKERKAARAGLLAARSDILAAERIDIFDPLTELLDFQWVNAAEDGDGPAWQAVIPSVDLALTWSARVQGWAIGKGGRRFVRAARASTVVGGRSLRPRIMEPEAPASAPATGPFWRPGEEVDIGDCGFTTRGVWLTSGASVSRACTSGAAHYRMTPTGDSTTTLGHLVILGGGESPFPLVLDGGVVATKVAATNGGTFDQSYPVGQDNWLWRKGGEWPAAFELIQGDWVLPVIDAATWTHAQNKCLAFPTLNVTGMAALGSTDRCYRMKVKSTAGWVTFGFLVRSTSTGALTWWVDPLFAPLRSVNLTVGARRVLAFTSGGAWRFEIGSPTSAEAGKAYAQLVT